MNTDEAWVDLLSRLNVAAEELDNLRLKTVRYGERDRLDGKAQGVRLAISYMRGYGIPAEPPAEPVEYSTTLDGHNTWPPFCPTCVAPWYRKSRTMGARYDQPHQGTCVNGHRWREGT